jgi:hypothetical protein
MIEKLASLGEPTLWTLFLLCAALMAIFPFWNKIRKALRIKFTNQQGAIHDFSWRLAPDHYLLKVKDNEYYLQSDGKQFILEGGAIILSWYVTGAYQIDIDPIGFNVKGNTAVITAKKERNHFVLTAYTLQGKLTKELILDPSLFRTLDTFNLSKELHFKQKRYRLKTDALTKNRWMNGKYKQGKMKSLPMVNTDRLNPLSTRYYYKKILNILHLKTPNMDSKSKVIMYISANKIVKSLRSNNNLYNRALNNNQEPI